MTSNNCAIFKVFLKAENTTEVRKFVVDDASVITSFVFIKEKLQSVFPKLRENYFKITWRDSDGDEVIIDGDEDLILAFTEMEGPTKTLYVTIVSDNHQNQFNPSNFAQSAPHIVCDVCNNEITTYRYKCLQCYDYDLCGACEHAGHHSHHVMLRTSTPDLPFARCGRKVFDHFNKAVKKASHMASRECKRKTKWEEKKSRHEKGENANGEGSKQQEQSCPFEEYVPQFYPLIDIISNAATNAANAAATVASNAAAASAGASAQSQNPNEQKQSQTNSAPFAEGNPTNQFIELVRNALSSVFVQPPHQQPNQAEATRTDVPTAEVPPQNQNNAAPKTPNAPMENEIDLTVEPMETSSGASNREPGWTILSNEEQASQSQYPILQPNIIPQTEPQDPVTAVALQQLLDMGFNNREALIVLLKRYNGNVHEVVKHIFENK